MAGKAKANRKSMRSFQTKFCYLILRRNGSRVDKDRVAKIAAHYRDGYRNVMDDFEIKKLMKNLHYRAVGQAASGLKTGI